MMVGGSSMFDYKAKWKLNSQSNEPFIKQLENNIRWSISAGDIAREERLPTIRTLAEELGISTNTVRSVYKKLEKDSYLVTRPHYGTFVLSVEENLDECTQEFQKAIKNVLRSALTSEEVRSIFEQTYRDYLAMIEHKPILLVETDDKTLEDLSKQIRETTGYPVMGMLLSDFDEYIKKKQDELDQYSAIVTTYFHYSQLRNTKGVYAPMVCGMVQNIRETVIDALHGLPAKSKVGIFCKRSEPISALQNLVLSVRNDIELSIHFDDSLDSIQDFVDKLLVICSSPATTDFLRSRMKVQIPVLELLDGINAQSMNMLVDFLK
jgi:DNA-binding transcriptional regulator YhcF (GntR family)